MTVILLNPDELTRNTILGGNIDVDKYIPALKNAQNTKIKSVLGKELYVKIMELFRDNELEVLGNELYLEMYEDYIKDMVIFSGAEIYLTFGAYNVGNGGITKMNTMEGQTSVNRTEVDFLVQSARKMYNHYEKEFLTWVKDKEIPEYPKTTTKKTMNVGGWVLQRKKC